MMDERDWTDAAPADGAAVALRGCTLTVERAPHLTLVSGDLAAAVATLAPDAPMLGLARPQPGQGPFAIRVARDHAVLVTASPPEPGTLPPGAYASRADDRYVRLCLRGPEAMALLSEGLAAPLPDASPSAALRFGGRDVLLTGLEDGLCLWAAPGDLIFLAGLLQAAGAE